MAAGHRLVVSRRHAADWWALTDGERQAVLDLLDQVREDTPGAGSVRVQFESGDDSGHAHIRVISATAAWPDRLHNGPSRPLLPAIGDLVETGDVLAMDLVVSFVMVSGLRLLQPHLDAVLDRDGRVRLLTTDYLGITEKAALQILLARCEEYGDRFQVKVHSSGPVSFHPKAYLLGVRPDSYDAAFVGSANISASGLRDGFEWTLETRDPAALPAIRDSFHELWHAPDSAELTQQLVDAYVQAERPQDADVVAVSAPVQPFTPTSVQREALDALSQTRTAGFKGGLVVMATGLGKTWLAAFDATRPEFRRVLFVAHREEILQQTREVFRAIRPDSTVGLVMGDQDEADADIVLATVQSLSRRLDRLHPERFDYVVIDEFHHAAAASYRRVVNHLSPAFLLGLTATPDRADGADLLSLCEDNLVFECDLTQGIERGLLSPFHYLGVPDPVDFAPLPWRNSRFDPDALELAVITQERTSAALREWQQHAGTRTLAFCVSRRHADRMARAFREAGISAAAVHSGPTSAPRHESLFDLERGALRVVFSVDMFNEGVDVPAIDTVLLLRPTASPVVFLQQIGRGLRLSPGKENLTVVDFVGNHRSFLLPARLLAGLADGRPATDAELRERLAQGNLELPTGCSVDYQVEARDELLRLLPKSRGRSLAAFVDAWVAEHGRRPTAGEAFQAGYNPASAPGRWFGFLAERGCLEPMEAPVVERHRVLLADVATTSMNKSYKMVALRAFCDPESLVVGMAVEELTRRSRQLVLRDPRLLADVSSKELADPARASLKTWVKWWRRWPLELLAGEGFALSDDRFAVQRRVDSADAQVLADLLNELIDWRLARYLQTRSLSEAEGAVVRVIQGGSGNPILALRRERNTALPEGRGIRVLVDSQWVTFDFMKVAVNVARRDPEGPNELASILRGWFGPDAGASGTDHQVRLLETEGGWRAMPIARDGHVAGEGVGGH